MDVHVPSQPIKARPMDGDERAAWYDGRIPRRMLAIPFGGPIKGRDLDGDWFSERTDVKPSWFNRRPALWHHGVGPQGPIKGDPIGFVENPEMEDDGWWVDFWLTAGAKRASLFRSLEERGGTLYGSSGAYNGPGLIKKSKAGEILVWPWVEQTLTTSPQNSLSVLVTAKAALEHFDLANIAVNHDALKAWLADVDALSSDLQASSSVGKPAATAGRVKTADMRSLREALRRLSDTFDDLT